MHTRSFYFSRGTIADLTQQVELMICNYQIVCLILIVGIICGYRIMAITSAFQVGDAGSIPAARSSI